LRVLLCSDVAAEGLNLHYLSHRLIHFDLPWSLMVFQQRNGRVDRYGQNATPIIAYLITESVHPRIRGDLRILEVLQQKDEQAYRNIGDPSVFMRVYDAAAEERLTEAAMAEGMSAETFDATYQPEPDEGEDFLSLFMTAPEESAAPVPNSLEAIAQLPGLFASDFAFCQAALEILSRETPLQWEADANAQRIVLTAPPDLQVRLRQLPRELWPEHGRFVLTDDARQIQREVDRCRQDETAWPKLHYLWPQHLVMDWLIDRLQAAFGRHRAPILQTPKLAAGEAAFLIAGTIPNRKGQPLVMHWVTVRYRVGQPVLLEDLATFLERMEIGRTPLVNTGAPSDLGRLQRIAQRHEQFAQQGAFQRQPLPLVALAADALPADEPVPGQDPQAVERCPVRLLAGMGVFFRLPGVQRVLNVAAEHLGQIIMVAEKFVFVGDAGESHGGLYRSVHASPPTTAAITCSQGSRSVVRVS
jgi:hypothetical protein